GLRSVGRLRLPDLPAGSAAEKTLEAISGVWLQVRLKDRLAFSLQPDKWDQLGEFHTSFKDRGGARAGVRKITSARARATDGERPTGHIQVSWTTEPVLA